MGGVAGKGVMLRPVLPAKRLASANFCLRVAGHMAGLVHG